MNNIDSLLDGNSAIYLEALYESYLEDPDSVSESWQQYFSNLYQEKSTSKEVIHSAVRARFKNLSYK